MAKQPFAQCALFTAESTAQAAQLAAGEEGAAAIGHSNLGALYGLNAIAQNIEDQANNWTRFAVIAPGFIEKSKALTSSSSKDQVMQKTTLLFTLNNQPGALASVLNLITRLNLSKLESRPALYENGAENWSYTFFALISWMQTCWKSQKFWRNLKLVATFCGCLGFIP